MRTRTKTTLISVAASTVLSTIFAGFVSFGFQQWGKSITLRKTARLEQVLDYTKAKSPITPFAAKFMAAIAGEGDISSAKSELRGKVADEMEKTEKLRALFQTADPEILEYQSALSQFADTLNNATDATKMRRWSEMFGKVLDSRQALDQRLIRDASAGA